MARPTDRAETVRHPSAGAVVPGTDLHEPDLEVQIQLGLGGLTAAAAERLGQCVQRFADDLARETARLEEGDRAETAEVPEITASTVIRANEAVRRPAPIPVKAQRSAFDFLVQLVSAFTLLGSGVLGSYLNSEFQTAIFTGTVVIALISTGYVLWRRL